MAPWGQQGDMWIQPQHGIIGGGGDSHSMESQLWEGDMGTWPQYGIMAVAR